MEILNGLELMARRAFAPPETEDVKEASLNAACRLGSAALAAAAGFGLGAAVAGPQSFLSKPAPPPHFTAFAMQSSRVAGVEMPEHAASFFSSKAAASVDGLASARTSAALASACLAARSPL